MSKSHDRPAPVRPRPLIRYGHTPSLILANALTHGVRCSADHTTDGVSWSSAVLPTRTGRG